MNELLNNGLNALMENSILGAILVYFLIQNAKLVKQLFKIIENNTKALAQMETLVSKCSKNGGKG